MASSFSTPWIPATSSLLEKKVPSDGLLSSRVETPGQTVSCALLQNIPFPGWFIYYKPTHKKNEMVFWGEKSIFFLSHSTGKLLHLFQHDLLEINVSCNFGSTKNRCNSAPTGNPSCSTWADKDEFSILMNHLNALVEEICSSVSTFVRLWCYKTCIPALKYLSFLFLLF